MAHREQFPAIFVRLKQNFQPFVPPLRVHADTPQNYAIVADPTAKYPEGFWVGAGGQELCQLPPGKQLQRSFAGRVRTTIAYGACA